MSDFAIRFQDVCKSFRQVQQRPFLAKEFLQAILQKPRKVELFEALRGISLTVEKGESIGVIGTNGSGKSTLLSLIARTSYPSSGTVEVRGRVGPLLELGAGFHPDLTGAENVYLNASLLGLSRKQVDERFDSIVEYSGIESFIDAPIQTYSTGMTARLGFAVIAHIDPEILIVDEALAVGDAEFQLKCERTMHSMIEGGATMFLVSHDMRMVRDLCTRVVFLSHGQIISAGKPEMIIAQYLDSLHLEAQLSNQEGAT